MRLATSQCCPASAPRSTTSRQRVTEMAERYGDTPDSAISAELFNAERALLGARRSIDRASGFLDEGTRRT